MKLYVEKTEITQAGAEAGQTKGKRLMTASEFFQIPEEQYMAEVYSHLPLRIENGLLARSVDDFGFGYNNRRYVVAVGQPSNRFGVLYIINEKPHKHEFVKQKDKCECGEERG